MQSDLFPVKSDWRPREDFPALEGPIAIDTETKDPLLNIKAPGFVGEDMGYIVGFSVATKDFSGYYPVRHEGGDNLPVGKCFRWLQSLLDKPGPKIFANAPYDCGWIQREGLEINMADVHDVQIMAPLLDENRRSYSLDNLAKDFLGVGKDEAMLEQAARQYGFKTATQIKSNMWRLPARYVGQYGEMDAVRTLQLYDKFWDMIRLQDLEYVYDLERRLIPIMLKMRQRGLRVDMDRAQKTKKIFMAKEQAAIKELNEMAGLRIDPYSPVSCAVMFDKFGVEYPRTATGIASITAPWLETIDHPAGMLVRKARKYQKAHSTFIQKYIIDKQINGRLHASFNQLPSDEGGTVSGRFSCSKPNLQNIPARDPEIGPMIRSLFLPEDGEEWMAADYANQEPRIMVHWAHKCRMDGAQAVVDRYSNDPLVSYHRIIQEILEPFLPEHLDGYKTAKTINLGLAYGMGGKELCKSLGLPTKYIQHWNEPDRMVEVAGDEGQKILDLYNKEVPYLKEISGLCQRRAKKRGYIKTISGRRCRFPDGFQHKALNRLIQGTAADQTKEAMIKMDEAGHTMILTMHDEIGLSIKSMDEARDIKKIMEEAIPMAVPFVCDIDIGPSWGEAREVILEEVA